MRALTVAALSLAACSDPTGALGEPDAALVARADAQITPQEITLKLWLDGQPASGIDVLFHDSSGALVKRVSTNGLGKAAAVMPSGGSVTFPYPGRSELRTVMDLLPGATLEAGRIPPEVTPTTVTHTVTRPAADWPGATGQSLLFGCDLVGPVGTVSVSSRCLGPDGRAAILGITVGDPAFEQILAFTFLADVDGATAGTHVLPPWSDAFDRIDVAVRNTPLDVEGGSFVLQPVRHGRAFLIGAMGGDFTATVPADGRLVFTSSTVPGFAEQYTRHISLTRPGNGCATGVNQRALVSPAAVSSIDFATDFLPRVTACSQAADGTLAIETAAPLPTADMLFAYAFTNGAFSPWIVYRRADARTVKLPELPADYATPPVTLDGWSFGFEDRDGIDGYEAFLSTMDVVTGGWVGPGAPVIATSRSSYGNPR